MVRFFDRYDKGCENRKTSSGDVLDWNHIGRDKYHPKVFFINFSVQNDKGNHPFPINLLIRREISLALLLCTPPIFMEKRRERMAAKSRISLHSQPRI